MNQQRACISMSPNTPMESLTTAYIRTLFWNIDFQFQMYAQPDSVSSVCSNNPGKLFAFKQTKL